MQRQINMEGQNDQNQRQSISQEKNDKADSINQFQQMDQIQDNRQILQYQGWNTSAQQSDDTGDAARKQPCIEKQIQDPQQSIMHQNTQIGGIINDIQFTRRMIMFKKEWKFLNYHLKIELDKIKQNNQCSFQISKNQNLHIDPILQFNGNQIFLSGSLSCQKYNAQIIIDYFKELKEPQLTNGSQINKIYIPQQLQLYQEEQQFQYIKQNINRIFEISQKEKYESLLIPIIGYNFKSACKEVLTSIIEQTNNSLFLKKIIIFETSHEKQEIILNTLQNLLYPQLSIYQWQFYDNGWIDYDFEINQQIDEVYQQFQKDKTKNQIIINLPYTKFSVKKQKLIFNDNIIQINLANNFERQVKFTQFVTKPLLDTDKFQFKLDHSLSRLTEYQVIIDIQSSDDNKLNQIEQKLRDVLEKTQQILYWKVKNFKDSDLINIKNTIRKRSIYFDGKIELGNELKITCFKKKVSKLQNYLKQIEQELIMFPKEWINQSQNLIKVQLDSNDEDYKKVQLLFQQSYPQGKIFQINRIQNKILYENFINEKRKLLQIKQIQGEVLNKIELKTYLWHGVRNNHPSIIYDSIKEAFKNNYCNLASYWGTGIYFANQAIYSKSYAYKLAIQDSVDYPNKLIFLLCEVFTGQCANLAPNDQIKEPPNGYDCVIGKSSDTDIYVLYGMDVRRAYPSFEIIFE